ncbi:hypothetical protein M422DRAFT_247264 [Sphaerobolus stellatus SS14]|nr:hypothetical protein M422DRAFT_247264 [Sphaerobolus stellatus SS14]
MSSPSNLEHTASLSALQLSLPFGSGTIEFKLVFNDVQQPDNRSVSNATEQPATQPLPKVDLFGWLNNPQTSDPSATPPIKHVNGETQIGSSPPCLPQKRKASDTQAIKAEKLDGSETEPSGPWLSPVKPKSQVVKPVELDGSEQNPVAHGHQSLRQFKSIRTGLSTTVALPTLPPTLAFPPVLVPAAAILIPTGTSSHNPTTNPGNTLERAIHWVHVVGEAGFMCDGGHRRLKGEVGVGMSVEGWGEIETPGEKERREEKHLV